MRRSAFVLLGPTASGKSRLALELAEKLPLEIVSLDSAQVYRGMDIGTAKPGPAERLQVPHHLIDLVDPDRPYSAGRWRGDAVRVIGEVLDRNRVPLLVGGTMLYYRALHGGLAPLPPAHLELRREIDAHAARRGWPALHAELARVDPKAASRIAPTDSQRIQRGLEVWRITGEPISAIQARGESGLPFALKAFALAPDRAELHRRIAERFDAMLAAGLVAELRELRRKFALDESLPSMRSVGYRQAWQFLEGRIDEKALRERGVVATRQLAKRQLTWLRSFGEVETIEPDAARLAARLHSFL